MSMPMTAIPRRSGLMGAWLMGAPGLEVRFLTPRSSNQDASHSPHFTYLRHQRHAVRPACLKLARSAFVLWPEGEVNTRPLSRRLTGCKRTRCGQAKTYCSCPILGPSHSD